MSQRVVIVSGGEMESSALDFIDTKHDLLIGADRGALRLIDSGYTPDIAIGDFDSITEEERLKVEHGSRQMIACDPVMKDYTDTEMAFRTAMDMKPDHIVILGGLGVRFDHSLSNVHLLAQGIKQGVSCQLRDDHNKVQLVDRELVIEAEGYHYVSLLPLTWNVTGINLKGFKYPLHNAELTIGQSLGISNELLEGKGSIRIQEGLLLVIQSKD